MSIQISLHHIQQKIIEAALQYNRLPAEIKLIAVSKKQSVAQILQAYAAGQCAFAENYVQEAVAKINQLQAYSLEWHFIGPIQSNKTAIIAEKFDWIHSIDRIKIAQRLNDSRNRDLPPVNVCIQVNVSNDPNKSGVLLSDVSELVVKIIQLPQLKLRGLMTIPTQSEDFLTQRHDFHLLKVALLQINKQFNLQLDTLSMGMSQDFVAAIAEGATLLRIGSAIFGTR